MSTFWKIETMDSWEAATEIQNRIPALKKVYVSDIEECMRASSMKFISKKVAPRPVWARISLPLAIVFLLLLLLSLPIKFMITGVWAYRWKWLSNWFQAVGF